MVSKKMVRNKHNTPGIIRFPFEKMVHEHPQWSLVRLNRDEAVIPDDLRERVAGIQEDIAKSLTDIYNEVYKKE